MDESNADRILRKSLELLGNEQPKYVPPEEDALESWEAAKPRERSLPSPSKSTIDPKVKAYINQQVGSLIDTIATSVMFERQRHSQQLAKLREELSEVRELAQGRAFNCKIGKVTMK